MYTYCCSTVVYNMLIKAYFRLVFGGVGWLGRGAMRVRAKKKTKNVAHVFIFFPALYSEIYVPGAAVYM